MAKLIYIAMTSLDGYVEDEGGTFDWAAPGEEVHRFVDDLLRPVGTYLYGRRMYETMIGWETMDTAELPTSRSRTIRFIKDCDVDTLSTRTTVPDEGFCWRDGKVAT